MKIRVKSGFDLNFQFGALKPISKNSNYRKFLQYTFNFEAKE